MDEAIKNLVVLMWTVSAINSGVQTQAVTEHSFENREQQEVVLTDVSALALSKQNVEKKLKYSISNT